MCKCRRFVAAAIQNNICNFEQCRIRTYLTRKNSQTLVQLKFWHEVLSQQLLLGFLIELLKWLGTAVKKLPTPVLAVLQMTGNSTISHSGEAMLRLKFTSQLLSASN